MWVGWCKLWTVDLVDVGRVMGTNYGPGIRDRGANWCVWGWGDRDGMSWVVGIDD